MNSRTIRLVSWNVNGIRAIMNKGFPEAIRQLDPDILCLQETRADAGTVMDIAAKTGLYKCFANAARKKGYSGTAVLTRIPPAHHQMDMGRAEHDQEGRLITLEYDDFILVNAYVPNAGQELKRLDYRKAWDRDLADYLSVLSKKPLVLTGDLNVAHEPIDLARPEQNYNKTAGFTQVEIDGFKNLLGLRMVDTYRRLNGDRVQYTFWNQRFNARAGNVGWRIDYFLVSESLAGKVKEAYIWDNIMGSDHCPVGIDLTV